MHAHAVPKLSAGLAAALLLLGGAAAAGAQQQRVGFSGPAGYLVVEALDDDLLHFEFGDGRLPADLGGALWTSPMVQKTDYRGARQFASTASTVETSELRLVVEPATLCVTATDKLRAVELTRLCPTGTGAAGSGLTLTRGRTRNLYGLGEQFNQPGQQDGDWLGRERVPGNAFGNRMVNYPGGQVGNAQFPILYAVGDAGFNYALFLDDVFAQHWDFRADPWTLRTRAPLLRGYLLSGPDLPDLRRDYLELTGTAPVPPRQAFGLWVSEYGYEDWAELHGKLASLRTHAFPVDGFVLDLQWYGGIVGTDSTRQGTLTWDTVHFPEPARQVAELRERHGVGLVPIEQSHIGRALPEHDEMQRRGFLVRQREGGPPVYLSENPWWGRGGMIDWTNPAAGTFWHDWKRQPLVELGLAGHWTDLGEPEQFDSTAWYHGVLPGRHDHASVHNLYNLLWSRSIFEGYRRHGVQRRPWSLTRSGTSGSQRYGVALWSGDIGSNLQSLAAHLNTQLHMSMSGVDYYGSDIGGFHRGKIAAAELHELYTQWFANGALLDVPVRPHTSNGCNCNETAPDRIGDRQSNLQNLRLRYRLLPYYYSLAHRAFRHGEPLVAPLFFYDQNDSVARGLGSEKLIGRSLLVATVAEHGQRKRDVYLPRGRWTDFYTNATHRSTGEWLRGVPLYRDGLFRLPLYVRAGAILPLMHVDEGTMNTAGRRTDGSRRDELVARVYADAEESRFTLFEDDGETVAYLRGAVATTTLAQRRDARRAFVTVYARQGEYAGAPAQRNNVVELVLDAGRVEAVRLDGQPLRRYATRQAWEQAESGWFDAGEKLVLAKSGALPVSREKHFEFQLARGG